MTTDEFQIGDVVVLKSGGPAMTVESIGHAIPGGYYVSCIWFDCGKKMKDSFISGTLEKSRR